MSDKKYNFYDPKKNGIRVTGYVAAYSGTEEILGTFEVGKNESIKYFESIADSEGGEFALTPSPDGRYIYVVAMDDVESYDSSREGYLFVREAQPPFNILGTIKDPFNLDPEVPMLTSSDGKRLYILGEKTVIAVDVSDPHKPKLINNFTTWQRKIAISGLSITGSMAITTPENQTHEILLIVGRFDLGLVIINTHDGSFAINHSFLPNDFDPNDITVAPTGEYVYVSYQAIKDKGDTEEAYAGILRWRTDKLYAPCEVVSEYEDGKSVDKLTISADEKYLFLCLQVDRPERGAEDLGIGYYDITEDKDPKKWTLKQVHYYNWGADGIELTPNGQCIYAISDTSMDSDAYRDVMAITYDDNKEIWQTNLEYSPSNDDDQYSFNDLYGGKNHIGPNVIIANDNPVEISSKQILKEMGFTNFINFDGGILRVTNTLTLSNPITLLRGGGTFETDKFALTLSGDISGNGSLVKKGEQTLTLLGHVEVNQILVQAGTLMIGDDQHSDVNLLSNVTLKENATLAGTGKVNNLDVAGGTVAPGDTQSIATLTINHDLAVIDKSSRFSIKLSPDGKSDFIQAQWVTLQGTLDIHLNAPFSKYDLDQTYTILHADTIIGKFSVINVVDQPACDAVLTYGKNEVLIKLAKK